MDFNTVRGSFGYLPKNAPDIFNNYEKLKTVALDPNIYHRPQDVPGDAQCVNKKGETVWDPYTDGYDAKQTALNNFAAAGMDIVAGIAPDKTVAALAKTRRDLSSVYTTLRDAMGGGALGKIFAGLLSAIAAPFDAVGRAIHGLTCDVGDVIVAPFTMVKDLVEASESAVDAIKAAAKHNQKTQKT